MSKHKIILYRSNRAKDGSYAICLRVTKQARLKYISLKLYAKENQWNTEACRFIRDRRLSPNYVEYNELLNSYEARADKVVREFADEGVDWTLNQFEDRFLNLIKSSNVYEFFSNHIADLEATNHTGNANCYGFTLRMLELFDAKFRERVFNEIDIKYVKSLDHFLQKRGCKGNTRKYYFKALRAIINKAIQVNEASAKSYPFGKGGFEISKLTEETEKRYLPHDYLVKLKTTEAQKGTSEFARRLFLFSFYCYGISFIDMAYLSRKNIVKLNDGNYIVYKRQKLKRNQGAKSIQIKITEEIEALLTWFKENTLLVEGYLLPIVSIAGYKDEQLYNHIRNRHSKYGGYLKKLAQELGFTDFNLTSYVSRHSMAMTLQSNKVPREVIGQIMGHTDLKTTNTYLDSFESGVINEASKVLYK